MISDHHVNTYHIVNTYHYHSLNESRETTRIYYFDPSMMRYLLIQYTDEDRLPHVQKDIVLAWMVFRRGID